MLKGGDMAIEWSNQKVLICGGAGMIGSHLAKTLAGMGSNVTIADNLSSASQKNIEGIAASFRRYDLRDKDRCKEVVRGQDYIFQLAANMGGIGYITSVGADIMYDSAQINLNMLDAYRNSDAKGYFYSSSACVYPEYLQTNTEVKPLKETDAYPAMPDQFYGWEKLFSEKVCEAFQKDYGLNIRMARFHNVFGPVYTAFDRKKGKAPCHIIYKVLTSADGAEIEIWGDGKQTRSFLYIDSCVEGVLKLVESDYTKPVNIGSDRLVTIDELTKIIIKISGKEIAIRHDVSKPQGVRGRNADLTLVKSALGWEPKISLEEGLRRTYQWAMERVTELENCS
jgi:nucleoside-diphosphate-sugar epimerase